MHNNEWSLVFFTLISQLSVGVLLLFSFLHFVQPNTGYSFNIWWKTPEILILVLLGIASIISLLHLGKPVNAPNSINNLMGSWISKEILGLGLLVGFVFVLFLMRWIFESPIWLLNLMMIITSLAGIVFIYSMSRIYMIETIPSWNTFFTPFSFFMSVTLFLLIGLLYLKFIELVEVPYKSIVLILIVFSVLHLGLNGLHQYRLSGMEAWGIETVNFSKGLYFKLFIARIMLITFSIVCLVILYLNLNIEKKQLIQMLGFFLIMALIIQEFIGRLLFYQSYIRLGV